MAAPTGRTPRLGLPYPTPDDDVDVPRDQKALADSLDAGATFIVGEVRFIAVVAAPTGWVTCDGAALGRSAFPKLYAAIGVTFGAGDGSTTFNVPDLRGRAVVGAGQGPGLTSRAVGTKWGVEAVLLAAAESGVNGAGIVGGVTSGHSHYVPLPVYYNGGGSAGSINNSGSGAYPLDRADSGFSSAGQSNDHFHTLTARAADAAHINTQPSIAVPAYIYAGT